MQGHIAYVFVLIKQYVQWTWQECQCHVSRISAHANKGGGLSKPLKPLPSYLESWLRWCSKKRCHNSSLQELVMCKQDDLQQPQLLRNPWTILLHDHCHAKMFCKPLSLLPCSKSPGLWQTINSHAMQSILMYYVKIIMNIWPAISYLFMPEPWHPLFNW